MKKALLSFVFVLSLGSLTARSVFDQLVEINKFWNQFHPTDVELESTYQYATEQEKITAHLLWVEKTLRKNYNPNYTETQIVKRNATLDILHTYAMQGQFPKNTHHPNQRVPYFIDDYGTPCAVGHLMIQTGNERVARKINKEHNYGYIKDLVKEYTSIIDWANSYGFEIDELAWIQPGYGPTSLTHTIIFQLSDTSYIINPHCRGSSDGIISVDSNLYSNLPGPLTATISLTTATYGNIAMNQFPEGQYTLEVKGSNGVIDTTFFNLVGPQILSALVTTPSGCNDSLFTGSIKVNNLSGGMPPYAYMAVFNGFFPNPPNPPLPIFGSSSNFFSPLSSTNSVNNNLAGYYFFYVKDVNNCFIDTLIGINDSAAYSQTNVLVPNTCISPNATIAVTTYAAGYSSPFVIDTFSLPAGSHTVSVSNNLGCSHDYSFNIPSQYWQTFATVSQNIKCNGDSTVVNVQAVNSSSLNFAPYTGAQVVNLGVGSYVFTMTDKNGCSDTASITLTQPAPISATVTPSPIICNGQLSTVNYSVNNAQGTYTGNFTNGQALGAGNYQLQIVDANTCTAAIPFTITAPTPVVNNVTYNPIKCFGDTTSMQYSTSGGTGPYQYNFDPNIPIKAGTYTIITVDNVGCFISQTYTITEPPVLILAPLSITQTSSGFDINTGAVGGTAPYTYNVFLKVSSGDSSIGSFTTFPISVTQTGTYKIEVVDNNGCFKSDTITAQFPQAIDQLDNIHVSISPNPATDFITINSLRASDFGNEIYILNTDGKIVLRKTITQAKEIISVQNLAKGFYIVRKNGWVGKVWIQ